MRTPLILAACATISSFHATAQVAPRASQLVDLDTDGIGLSPSVATDGDLTVIAYCDSNGGRNAVEVVTSDGRGTAWSAPVRVDGGVAGDTRLTQYDACKVFGQNVYVVWEDDRSPTNGHFDLYFNRSTDGGATFGTEKVLDKGYPVDTGSIREWRFVAANTDDLYVFFSVIDSVPSGQIEAYLLSSHDGGVSWNAPVRVDQMTADPAFDVERIAIAVDPLDPQNVHMAWIDTRNGSSADVYYRRSTDGGSTLAGSEVQIDSSGIGTGDAMLQIEIAVDVTGQNLAIAWLEDGLTDADEQLQVAFSADGGASVAADITVGGGAAGSDDIDSFALAVFGPVFYVAWDDNRTGSDLLYVASAIPGQPFGAGSAISNADGGRPRIAGSPDGLVVGVFFDADTGAPDAPEAAITIDGGANWQGMLEYGDQPTNDADFVEVAYNPAYRNFVSAWLSNTGSPTGATRNRVWAGGFRIPTCTAIGWTDIYNPAEADLGFAFQGFGTDQFAIVGLSLNPGPITIAGQTWGIGPTVAPFGGPGFVAPLVGGAGATILLPNIFAGAGPGSGIPVYFAAIGFNPTTGFSRTTDVFSFSL